MAPGDEKHAVTAAHSRAGQTSDGAIRQGRFWWVAVLRGALALLFGAAALVSPRDRTMLANFIGLYWLLGGLLTLRWALAVRWRRGSHLGLVAGTVGVIAASAVNAPEPDRCHENPPSPRPCSEVSLRRLPVPTRRDRARCALLPALREAFIWLDLRPPQKQASDDRISPSLSVRRHARRR